MQRRTIFFLVTMTSILITLLTTSQFVQTNALIKTTSSLNTSTGGLVDPSTAMLIVINHVANNSRGGSLQSSDFKMIVFNLNITKKPIPRLTQTFDLINGSEIGTSIRLMPGLFSITDDPNMNKSMIFRYNTTFSGDCHPVMTKSGVLRATGDIHAGEAKTCFIDRIFLDNSTVPNKELSLQHQILNQIINYLTFI